MFCLYWFYFGGLCVVKYFIDYSGMFGFYFIWVYVFDIMLRCLGILFWVCFIYGFWLNCFGMFVWYWWRGECWILIGSDINGESFEVKYYELEVKNEMFYVNII